MTKDEDDDRWNYLNGWRDALKFQIGWMNEILVGWDAIMKVGENFDWDDRHLQMMKSFHEILLEEVEGSAKYIDEMAKDEVISRRLELKRLRDKSAP